MTKLYCASCDRVNHKKAAFCGSCGQPLSVVGSHLERLSFPLWRIVIALSIGFVPATLLFILLGDTYWSIEAYERLISDASFKLTSILVSSFLFYSAFYISMMQQFQARRIMQWLNDVHIATTAAGIAISAYFFIRTIRYSDRSHEVLKKASTAEAIQIHHYMSVHYGVFLLFYTLLFSYALRVAMKRRRTHKKAQFGR